MSLQLASAQENGQSRSEVIQTLINRVNQKVRGQESVVEMTCACFLAKGHLLLEGPPGVGKTSLAKELASCIDGNFRRVQMTSDLLPGEIVGSIRPGKTHSELEFRPGPIFSNLVLADELNRTSPKTQSALLEAMAEGTVTVDGQTHELPNPFFVVATQNPLESHGVYPLAESQLDRFTLQIAMELPSEEKELEIYTSKESQKEVTSPGFKRTEARSSIVTLAEMVDIQNAVEEVFIEKDVQTYAHELIKNTRKHPQVSWGVSVRGGLQLTTIARALAFVRGRDFVTPQDLHDLAVPALAHRLRLEDSVWELEPKRVVLREILRNTPMPK